MLKVILDTNILVASLSSRSPYHWIVRSLLDERFQLYITTEIVLEYEEVLRLKYSEAVAANFLVALKELPNVHFTQVYFHWDLISDKDDNKFVDCYVAAGAQYLISHDAHFSVLKDIAFPKVNVLKIDEFKLIVSHD